MDYSTLACVPLGVLSIWAFFAIQSNKRSLKFLRGPPNTSLLLGNEYDILQQIDVGGVFLQWMEEYGSAYRAKTVLNEDMLIITDPKALQHMFHKSSYHFPKSADTVFTSMRIFGPGVVAVQGLVHQRQRKIMMPAFSAAQIKPFVAIFQRVTNSLIAQWRERLSSGEDIIDTTKWLSNLTLDALGEAVFDYEFGALESKNNHLAKLVRNLFVDTVRPTKARYLWNRMRTHYLPSGLANIGATLHPTKEDVRFKHWQDTSKAEAKMLYKNKLQGEASAESDVLGVISRSLDAEDAQRRMDADEALSQMSTIILAGHETSGNTLNWLLYELAKHPDDQERIFKEIRHAREQKSGAEDLTANDFDSMPFLHAVVKETLRLHPIVPRLVREAEDDDVIPLAFPVVSASGELLSEIPVAKGQRIWVSVIGYNYMKEVWGEDADQWNPDRHLDAKRAMTLGMYGNLMSFGAGVRGCIGWRFAVHEIQTVAALLIESFTFSMIPGVEIAMINAQMSVPIVKGKMEEGVQMPVRVQVRE
ncbi:hypothetical protein VNI00_013738 [Paramarasmius palmivorus]|uniref:Cytochrome P450 n=1 Tax=Paramarasmius palmivorus TaxID=297713 RepID=A0AAW0BWA7_9AGAR